MKSLSLFTLLAAALVAAATISTTTVDAYTYMVYRGTASCNTSEDGVSVMYYWSSINACSESNDTTTNTNIYSSVSNCDATNGYYNTSYHGSNSTCENTPTNSSFMTGTCYSFGTTPPSSWRLSCENVTMNTTTTTSMMANTTMDNSTTTMMNSTNTTTTMMSNSTTMAGNSTSMMPTNGTWSPSNSSGSWWAWLEAQPMDPMTFVLNDFIVGLSARLMVNSNVFNGTIGADGTVHLSVYAWNATEIAFAATQLSPADFSALNVVNIFEASTTTSGSYTTITGINSTTSTSMMPANSSMPPDNSSMAPSPSPGNSSVPPMPTPPPSPPACNTLTFHVNCAQQSHCQEWNMTCVPKCSEANGNSTKCDMWPHCWNRPGAGEPSSCHTSCGMLNRDACFTSKYCGFYNDQCGLICSHYGNDMTKCNNDKKCFFDDATMMCKTHCDLAHDAISCLSYIGIGECGWNKATMKCAPSCKSLSANACSATPECSLYAAGKPYAWCSEKCSLAKDIKGCSLLGGCSWSMGKCNMDCNGITDSTECNSRPDCGAWDASSSTCYTVNCSIFKNDTSSCNSYNNEDSCVVDENMMCENSCNNRLMINSAVCDANPKCMYNSTTFNCAPKPCSSVTDENACAYRRECTFAGGSCLPACDRANGDWATCDMWSHCMWDSSKMHCLPKCTMQTTKMSCLGSNNQMISNSKRGPCFWASDSLGCQQGTCGDHTYNSTACSMKSFCVDKRDNMFDTCVPSCGRALTEMDCMNPFFQSNLACMWNKDTMKCTDNCAYITSMQQCTGPCAWNYNFSACLPKDQAPMPSSTMMPSSSSQAVTNTTASDSTPSPSTTSSDASSTTAAPTTTSNNNNNMGSTTSTMAPQTQAATTTPAPPVGNPRVKFTLNATAAVSYESNTAEKVQEFLDKLAEVLGVPASSISGTFSASDNAVVVEFKQDAKDSSGNAVNVTAEVEKATNLTPTQMSSLGAASSETAAPAPAGGDAPEDDGPNIAVIAGAAAGGLVLLLVILFVIKKQSSGGTGYSDDQVGDRPMLEVPHANQPGHPQL